MTIVLILLYLLFLILLIGYFKVSPFISFLIIAILIGIHLGLPFPQLVRSIEKGIGEILGSLVIVLCAGAMIGKLIAESGASQRIATSLMKWMGEKNILVAMVITSFIIGIPLFYNVAFVLVIPLIFSVAYQFKRSPIYIGLPMLCALSVTHGFLPPHPSPVALVVQLNADITKTLLYGFIIAIPTIIIAGPLFAQTVKKIEAKPLASLKTELKEEKELPSVGVSFFTALFPIGFLISLALIESVISTDFINLKMWIRFLKEPSIVMICALIVSSFSLGISKGKTIKALMALYEEALKDILLILLILAGSGALKQVLIDSGASSAISNLLTNIDLPILILGWLIAVVTRILLGSATIAGLTASSILAPIMHNYNVDLNLMVLAIGSGSLMFSHINDSGFWMFKEYFSLSVKDTFRTWTIMESIVSICGLIGVLVIQSIL